jgi:hypothetical protein
MWHGSEDGDMRRILRWALFSVTALSLAGFLVGVASWLLASHDRTRAILAAASRPIQPEDALAIEIEDAGATPAATIFEPLSAAVRNAARCRSPGSDDRKFKNRSAIAFPHAERE